VTTAASNDRITVFAAEVPAVIDPSAHEKQSRHAALRPAMQYPPM
jgi:hypothetical protein